MNRDETIDRVVEVYLASEDFNGLPTRSIDSEPSRIRAILVELLESGAIDVVFGDGHPNTHIKAFKSEPRDLQIEKAKVFPDIDRVCVYPSPEVLAARVDRLRYTGRPFTLRLALGAPQLEHLAFELTVLEHYRNDPRYFYRADEFFGLISVSDEYYKSKNMRDSDQVLLQSFGFCYDAEFNRAVAVFLRYLADLSPEHQQVWITRALDGDYKLHPAYFDSSIRGEFPDGVSIFHAFVEEQHQINAMCELIGKPPLFRKEFTEEKRPTGFTFLIRPTLKEFNDFVLLLDQMTSDNINFDFFKGDVERESFEKRSDGTLIAKSKGSLLMLEEWLTERFVPKNRGAMNEMFATFKKVRRLRQQPAHAVRQNEFDQKYFKEQRALIVQAYDAIRLLRLTLANHPAAKGYQVPEWLGATIYTY